MSIFQGTIQWGGWGGAPGFTNLHWSNEGVYQTAVDNGIAGMQQFVVDIASLLPDVVTLAVSSEVKEINEVTGALIALASPSTPAAGGSGSAGVEVGPAPAGLCIAWGTGGVNRGRVVRGRTFVVPLSPFKYQSDGTLTAAAVTDAAAAATNWRTSSAYESLIWSRPIDGAGGAAFPILSSNVRDKVAVLRSRRD